MKDNQPLVQTMNSDYSVIIFRSIFLATIEMHQIHAL